MKLSIGAACVFAAVLVVLSPFAAAFAQTPEPAPGKKINSLESGAWALVFDVDTDAILTSYNGAVSVKRHMSPKTAYRAGLSFSTFWRDEATEQTDSFSDLETARDDEMATVGLYADYLRYANPDARVNFYWGVGPYVRYSRQEQSFSSSVSDNIEENVFTVWQGGVAAKVGVEWFAAKSLGFHAEYSVFGRYDSYRQERTVNSGETSNLESTADGWTLGTGGVMVGLSAYF